MRKRWSYLAELLVLSTCDRGWMVKKGDLVKNMKRRYFVLTGVRCTAARCVRTPPGIQLTALPSPLRQDGDLHYFESPTSEAPKSTIITSDILEMKQADGTPALSTPRQLRPSY